MKELYTSPELKVTCFAPVERLAGAVEGDTINFDDMLGAAGLKPSAGRSQGRDIDLKL